MRLFVVSSYKENIKARYAQNQIKIKVIPETRYSPEGWKSILFIGCESDKCEKGRPFARPGDFVISYSLIILSLKPAAIIVLLGWKTISPIGCVCRVLVRLEVIQTKQHMYTASYPGMVVPHAQRRTIRLVPRLTELLFLAELCRPEYLHCAIKRARRHERT